MHRPHHHHPNVPLDNSQPSTSSSSGQAGHSSQPQLSSTLPYRTASSSSPSHSRLAQSQHTPTLPSLRQTFPYLANSGSEPTSSSGPSTNIPETIPSPARSYAPTPTSMNRSPTISQRQFELTASGQSFHHGYRDHRDQDDGLRDETQYERERDTGTEGEGLPKKKRRRQALSCTGAPQLFIDVHRRLPFAEDYPSPWCGPCVWPNSSALASIYFLFGLV